MAWLTAFWQRRRPDAPRPQRPQRQRIERYFECNWVGSGGEVETRVRSISPTGCYIDSRLAVPPEGTRVREIHVALPGGCITVEGMVLQTRPGDGFAVRFTSVDTATRAMLSNLCAVSSRSAESASLQERLV